MPGNPEKNRWPDVRLLHAASQGDEEAFVIFCARTLPFLVRTIEAECRRRKLDASIAESVAQQTINEAITEVQTGILPKNHRDWLTAIAIKLLTPSPAKLPRRTKPEEQAHKFLDWLPYDGREMLELVMLKAKTVEEAGKTMGLDPDEAQQLYEDSLRHLSDFIDEHGSH
jgi:hypothetical protein